MKCEAKKSNYLGCFIAFGVALIAGGTAIFLIVSSSRRPSLNQFRARDQKFYEDLALACNHLLFQTNVVKLKPNHRPIASTFSVSPNDANLPDAIRNIRPTYIEVDRCDTGITNCLTFVWIKIGAWGAGYGIRWSTNLSEQWELSASGEGGGGVVYTKPAVR